MVDQLLAVLQMILGFYTHDMDVFFGPDTKWWFWALYLFWFPIKWVLIWLPLLLLIAGIRKAK